MLREDYSEELERVNKDYLSVLNSKEYKVGKMIIHFLKALKAFKICEAIRVLSMPILSIRLKKYNAKQKRFVEKKIEKVAKKIVVYTVIFGDYDAICEPMYIDEDCDYYIITDKMVDRQSNWTKLKLPSVIEEKIRMLTQNEKNRFFKMNPFVIFPEYENSIYIDGNLEIVGKISKLVSYINDTTGIAMFNHPSRGCIYDEGKACEILKKSNKKATRKQLDRYENNGMPKKYGMFECNVIVRKKCGNCNKIMEDWWIEYLSSESKRDQLSFPYILWKNEFLIGDVGCLGECMSNSSMFRRNMHI